MKRFFFLLLLFPIFFLAGIENPVATYLTLEQDPTTTVTVQWITKKGEETHDLYYVKEGSQKWSIALARQIPLPKQFPYVLQRVELFKLEPGETYLIKPGSWDAKTLKFRTLSDSKRHPLQFIVGGDIYDKQKQTVIQTHRQAAKQSPHFAVLGGDIAYACSKTPNNNKEKHERWIEFLQIWSEEMVTPEGYSIPIIAAIGNHDVNGRFGQSPEYAQSFYSFFSYPKNKGFHLITVNDYFCLFLLDSGHTNNIFGKQSQWLENTLIENQQVTHKFAAYHVPAYPSVRSYQNNFSTKVRKFWVPIFEKYDLTAAFEHHDHAYKRTHPILNGRISNDGVIYLGDGAYGVHRPRTPKSPYKRWYLAQSARERHFILVTLNENQRKFQAINSNGVIFDQYEQTVTTDPLEKPSL